MTAIIENTATDNKPTKLYEFIVMFKRHDGRIWVNGSRTFKAKNARDAFRIFTEHFRGDTVPPRMTKIAKTVMVGEVVTEVRPVYV